MFYLKRINEPSLLSKIYYVYKDEKLFPCIVLNGSLFENDRLSNVWEWKNLITEVKEGGYGHFFEIIEEDCENCKHFCKNSNQYPCSHCSNCYTSKFKSLLE